ncbi:MAG: trehalose 6-phosphate phosphatase [Burkholderiales bacterium]|jgi:trehalose 6-phosphate phosphatase
MSLPFYESSSARLDEIVGPGLLCAFDFDGTLAPIVAQPEKAHLPTGILQRLVTLAQYTPVAVITGRSVADIRSRLGFQPDFVVGNHGLEGVPGAEHSAELCEQLCAQWEQRLAAALQDRSVYDPGIRIENKVYSLSVHYRLARDRAKAERQLAALFARLTADARVVGGKCVFNLLPPEASDKGVALERLMQASGARSAIYIGDDVTDEDIFRLPRPDLLSVRVGLGAGSAAEFFLYHRIDVTQVLDELIGRLRQVRAENWVNAEPFGRAHDLRSEGL